jgi:hypothetical protein
MGSHLRGDWILFVWTCPVAKLLKCLVLMICPFFSSIADPECDEIVEVAFEGLSPSIREL